MAKPFDVSKFRKTLTKSIDGLGFGFNDPTDWISTGNYALNYLISSDFNKGIPLGKVTVFAGESGAGTAREGGDHRDECTTMGTASGSGGAGGVESESGCSGSGDQEESVEGSG